MGVGLMVGATLLGGLMQARAQREQANAQARQAEVNAQIAYQNSEKMQAQAEETAKNNAINQEQKRRQLVKRLGSQQAAVGASGLTMSGSALDLMAESKYEMERELAVDRYNDRQKVDNIFQNSTDYLNQGDIYKQNAKDYRKAGKRAAMNTMLQTAFTLAAGLYSPGSSAAVKSKDAITAGTGALSDTTFTIGGQKLKSKALKGAITAGW